MSTTGRLTSELMASHNLVLVGNARTNAVVAKLAGLFQNAWRVGE